MCLLAFLQRIYDTIKTSGIFTNLVPQSVMIFANKPVKPRKGLLPALALGLLLPMVLIVVTQGVAFIVLEQCNKPKEVQEYVE